MSTLKRFRAILTITFIVSLFIISNILMSLKTIELILTTILGFIIGIEWITLLITDENGKYYMRIREGSLIEFVKIVVQSDRLKKDPEKDKVE